MARRDEHVTRGGAVFAAVAQAADARGRDRGAQAAVPLLHQDPRRHHDQDELPAMQRIRHGRDRDIGLARAGDGFDDPSTTTAQPADERVELPAIELRILGSQAGEHRSAASSCGHVTNNGTGTHSHPGTDRACAESRRVGSYGAGGAGSAGIRATISSE